MVFQTFPFYKNHTEINRDVTNRYYQSIQSMSLYFRKSVFSEHKLITKVCYKNTTEQKGTKKRTNKQNKTKQYKN